MGITGESMCFEALPGWGAVTSSSLRTVLFEESNALASLAEGSRTSIATDLLKNSPNTRRTAENHKHSDERNSTNKTVVQGINRREYFPDRKKICRFLAGWTGKLAQELKKPEQKFRLPRRSEDQQIM